MSLSMRTWMCLSKNLRVCYSGRHFSQRQVLESRRTHTESYTTTGYSFDFTKEQQKLKENAKSFAREEILPLAAKYDRAGRYPREILDEAWHRGLTNHHIPKKYGGAGLGTVEECMVAVELGYACSGFTVAVEANSLGSVPLLIGGDEQLKKKYLTMLTEEPTRCAYAVTEPSAGSDVAAIRTRAVKKGDEYILNGSKMWITSAGEADWYFVLARTDCSDVNGDGGKLAANKTLSGFIVEREWPGVTVGRKELNMGQRVSDTRGVTFDDVRIPASNLIGQEGQGFKLAMAAFDQTRPAVAANAIGLAERCLDESVKYVLDGRCELNEHAISNYISNMATGIEGSKAVMYRSAWMIDNGQRNTYYASIAKCMAAEMANKCAADAVELFGLNGLNADYPVEKLMRDAKIFQIYEGTSQIQRIIISRELLNNARQ
ncbi:unnamed protein product [Owenia fusiformis]|uniref:Medium-chain specific acyl-CoA dehydrogenase, mitochondrial n=1 Tax=Owenia fusiformis TaxID=6347 RepID=A0A8J1TU25_OWEFU|nr:unnamed protein product [Owenia fusiformis]